MQKNEKSGEIDDAAARWAVRIDRGPLTQTEELALDQWLSHDSRHQGALVRAQALLLPAQGAAELMPVGGARSQGAAFRTGWAAGITSVAAAVGVSFLLLQNLSASDNQSFQTARGEVRRVPLEDGSVMTLNTASKAGVDFGPDQRSVYLASGEGYFEVAHDADRPFTVSAENYTVRAVGTAFVVRRSSDDSLEVVVQEGVVEFEAGKAKPLRLEAGGRVDVSLTGGQPVVSTLDGEQLTQELAWREGKIALTGHTLAEAALAFNRYNARPITVDPDVARLEVVGWYSSNDPVGFSKVVAQTMDVEADISPERILLKARSCDSGCRGGGR